jgi:hypothetical protein
MKKSFGIKLVAAAAAVAAVLGGGVAIAATQVWSPKEESEAVIDDAAKQLGVEPSELSDALKQALKNRVDDAVEDGRLTEEQGEALKTRIDSTEVPLPFGVFPLPHLELGHIGPFGSLETAASYLGLSETELRSRLANGRTLAEIAKAEGKTVDGLVQALLDNAEKKLDAAVAAGKLTAKQADDIREGWKERITDLVNAKGLGPGFGFRHRGFGFGFDKPDFERHRFGHFEDGFIPSGPSA